MDDPFEYITPPLKIVSDMVAIPRERYEALMAAAKALAWQEQNDPFCECPKCGRTHHKLANDPPKAIRGVWLALLAAAKAAAAFFAGQGDMAEYDRTAIQLRAALAALRAAGIQTGENPND